MLIMSKQLKEDASNSWVDHVLSTTTSFVYEGSLKRVFLDPSSHLGVLTPKEEKGFAMSMEDAPCNTLLTHK